MSKVFVVNFSGHDYEQAEKIGKLIFLTRSFVPLADDKSFERLRKQIDEKLDKDNASEEDYLLISGATLIVLVAIQVWLSRFPFVKLLSWDKSSNEYKVLTMTHGEIIHGT